jgi:PKD repeat protein
VVSTPDGGYLFAGDARSTASVVSSDVWLVKTSSSGSLVWEKRFGGTLYENAKSVITTTNGGYAVAGTTLSFPSGGGQDAWLIRTDSSGTELWNHSYGSYGIEAFESLVQTADGGLAAAGVTSSYGSGGDVYLVRTDASGNEQWHANFGGASSDRAMSLRQLPDGGYIIAGWTYSLGPNECNVFLIRTNADGQLIWQKSFGHNRLSYGNDVLTLADGGFLIVGYTDPYPSPGHRSVYAVRTDASGNLIWEKTPGDMRIISEGRSVTEAPDGGFVITGGSLGLFIVKIGSDGTTLWETVIDASPNDWGDSVKTTSDGGFIIGGTREQPGNNWDFYLVRIAPERSMPVSLPGSAAVPTDPDGDGHYEDLNGNGAADFNDVVLFFTYLEWIADNEPISLFDFNGNGQVDFADITRLFEEL